VGGDVVNLPTARTGARARLAIDLSTTPVLSNAEGPVLSPVLATERLRLRRLDLTDAPFVIELVNEPGWLEYIGDKNVHSIEDAHRYLREGPIGMYERHGFGLYLVERKQDGIALGMCGLIKRDTLEHPDIGFALLARMTGQGYAQEAAAAVVGEAKSLRLPKLLAVTTPTNRASQRVLAKVGLRFEREIKLSEGAETLHLFVAELERT
jgi:RimJ/RimL family protein N-acetyltransferase